MKRPLTDKRLSERVRRRRSVSNEEVLIIEACSGGSTTQCREATVTISIPGAATIVEEPTSSGKVTLLFTS